jgi:hypothetical protein
MISDILNPNIEPSPKEVQIAVLEQIKYVIENELAELEHAVKERPVNAVAWIGRNLLELWVWTIYCARSPENARQFFDDSARDALGALNLPEGMFSNDPNFSFKTAQAEILEEGKQKGVEGLDSSYQKVSEAAKAIGKLDYYLGANKLYSKFAHPTALWIMTEQEILEGFRKIVYDGGVAYGNTSLKYIQRLTDTSQ